MIVTIDTNIIIHRKLHEFQFKTGYITDSVKFETRDEQSRQYLDQWNFNLISRNPTQFYIERVKEIIRNRPFKLSNTDIEVIALTLELYEESNDSWITPENIKATSSLVCLTDDNAMKCLLSEIGLLNDEKFQNKRFKLRCYACFECYDEDLDFCKKCGYATLTKVSVIEENGQEKILLSKNYKIKPIKIMGPSGKEFICADQKEYIHYKQILKSKAKSNQNFEF